VKYLNQLAIIFAVCLAGQFIAELLPFPFPGSVLALIILLIMLLTKLLKPNAIKDVSEFLLNNMAFLFVPSGVALIEQYTNIKGHVLTIFLICIVTTILTFLATAYAVIGTMKLADRIRRKKND